MLFPRKRYRATSAGSSLPFTPRASAEQHARATAPEISLIQKSMTQFLPSVFFVIVWLWRYPGYQIHWVLERGKLDDTAFKTLKSNLKEATVN